MLKLNLRACMRVSARLRKLFHYHHDCLQAACSRLGVGVPQGMFRFFCQIFLVPHM